MITPASYGNASKYFTGSYAIGGGGFFKTAPARFLSGLVSPYNIGDGVANSNLKLRSVNYYSTANLDSGTRQSVTGCVFCGIKGHQLLVFPINDTWTFQGIPT